jgi:hypothetical protein
MLFIEKGYPNENTFFTLKSVFLYLSFNIKSSLNISVVVAGIKNDVWGIIKCGIILIFHTTEYVKYKKCFSM